MSLGSKDKLSPNHWFINFEQPVDKIKKLISLDDNVVSKAYVLCSFVLAEVSTCMHATFFLKTQSHFTHSWMTDIK